MSRLRVILATRKFWPHVGGAEKFAAYLAEQLNEQGAAARIVTGRLDRDWPRRVDYRGVPVERLRHPGMKRWGTFRYMRALNQWLRKNVPTREPGNEHIANDLVCASMLKHAAYVAVGAMQGTRVPVILRAEDAGEKGDTRWHEKVVFGQRIRGRCQMADAIVAPSEQIIEELADAGFDRDRLHLIPNGVPIGPQVNEVRRKAARHALAAMAEHFEAPENGFAAVSTAGLDRTKGALDMVDAWKLVIDRVPNARLWLVGDGRDRGRVIDRIHKHSLKGRVILAGVFTDVDDLLHAADLFVLASHAEGMSIALLEAMAVGLPIVASDIPGNRQVIADGKDGRMVPRRNSAELAEAILSVAASESMKRRLGEAARDTVRRWFSIENSARQHLELFEQVLRSKNSAG
jgi:glycosyltransferase involved in cell wall biosynthesis